MVDRHRLDVRSKIWLVIDGKPVFGQGRDELLKLIQRTDSINRSAKLMGITYRKAWSYINSMEKRLGFPLVNRLKGGRGGGESTLTPEAVDLLEKFDLLQKGFIEMVDKKFSDIDFTKLNKIIINILVIAFCFEQTILMEL
jgi:molybdate transport system regulatory protein